MKEHAYVWREILLDEENKELGLVNTNIGAVVKLNNINRTELSGIDKLICL